MILISKPRIHFLAILWLIACAAPVFAEPFGRSGPTQVSLIEVYTSDGCSSCPPAEEWVSRLSDSPGLWKDFVPVAFHVDYWDHLGWKDVLSDKRFTARQQAYANAWGNDHVYTPGFVRNGKEWRDWRGAQTIRDPDKRDTGELIVERNAKGLFTVAFEPLLSKPTDGSYVVHATLLGFGLASNVTAGENAGRRIVHDFAVVEYVEVPLEVSNSGHLECKLSLDLTHWPTSKKLALAVWVSKKSDSVPLQVAGGYL